LPSVQASGEEQCLLNQIQNYVPRTTLSLTPNFSALKDEVTSESTCSPNSRITRQEFKTRGKEFKNIARISIHTLSSPIHPTFSILKLTSRSKTPFLTQPQSSSSRAFKPFPIYIYILLLSHKILLTHGITRHMPLRHEDKLVSSQLGLGDPLFCISLRDVQQTPSLHRQKESKEVMSEGVTECAHGQKKRGCR